MLCPYCRNKIEDNSEKCEICGVDLSYQQVKRKQNITGGVVLLCIGIIFTFMGIFSCVSLRMGMNYFKDNSNIQSAISLFSFAPLFIGILLTMIGIIGMKNGSKLEGEENPKVKIATSRLTSLVITIVFFIIWYVSLGSMFGMLNKPSDSFSSGMMITFAVFPIPIFLIFVVSVFKGKK